MFIETLRECMSRALKLDGATANGVTEATTAGDLAGWTSLGHLALILELEAAFRVSFDNGEIASLGSVAAIRQRLAAKGVSLA